ncbi:transporter [Caulobacter vibrioides]|nr:transporter [Caulobacter vibrioides]
MSFDATADRRRPAARLLARMGLGAGASLAVLALAGCNATAPRTPDTRLPAAFEAPAGTPLPAAALDQWWTQFNDPQLNGLIATALEKSPDARSAAAVLEEARAVRKGQIRQLFIPSGQIKGAASRQHTDILDQDGEGAFTLGGNADNYSLGFDVSWELDYLGRRKNGLQVVNNDLAAARFAYEGARAALAANVAQSYFEAKGLAVQLEDARQSARISTGLRDLATEKARRGLSAGSEADSAAATLAQSEAQAADLESQLQAARRSLLILVGRGIDPLASLSVDAALAEPPAIPAAVPGELLARRPDVREAQARLASAAGNLKVNQKALYPTFTLTPGVGWAKSVSPAFNFGAGGAGGGTVSTTTGTWTLGGNVSIPLLNIPQLLAEIDAQDARTEQAAVAYEKAIQTAYGEAENAMAQLASDQRRVTLLKAGETRAANAYAASRKGYAAGLTDQTTNLQNEQSWRSARTALTGAQTQALLRAVQTYKALGGGWSPNAPAPLPPRAASQPADTASERASR